MPQSPRKQARPRPRPPARAVKPLSRTITRIVGEELERAFYRTGRRILSLYLETLAQPQALAICQSPDRLRAAVEAAIAAAGQSSLGRYLSGATPGMLPITRDCLALLDRALRSQKSFVGIPLPEATDLLYKQLRHRISPHGLRVMLSRTAAQHRMVVKNRRVMLRADILINMLEAQHKKNRERKGLV